MKRKLSESDLVLKILDRDKRGYYNLCQVTKNIRGSDGIIGSTKNLTTDEVYEARDVKTFLQKNTWPEIVELRGCAGEMNQAGKMLDSLVYSSYILCFRCIYLRHLVVIVVIIIDLISVLVKITRHKKCNAERGQTKQAQLSNQNAHKENSFLKTSRTEVKLLGQQYFSVFLLEVYS